MSFTADTESMNNCDQQRRKTLPVVRIEEDLDEEHLPRRVLPILAAPYSPIPEGDQLNIDEPVSPLDKSGSSLPTPTTAVPSWLQLAPEDNTMNYVPSTRVRHSVGLDVPGAVHTITTPSKVLNNN